MHSTNRRLSLFFSAHQILHRQPSLLKDFRPPPSRCFSLLSRYVNVWASGDTRLHYCRMYNSSAGCTYLYMGQSWEWNSRVVGLEWGGRAPLVHSLVKWLICQIPLSAAVLFSRLAPSAILVLKLDFEGGITVVALLCHCDKDIGGLTLVAEATIDMCCCIHDTLTSCRNRQLHIWSGHVWV